VRAFLSTLVTGTPRVAWGAAGVLGVAVLAYVTLAFFGSGPDSSRLIIRDGDTLARLFARAKLPDDDLLAVMEAGHGAAFGLDIIPGEEVRIARRDDGSLESLVVGRGGGQAIEFIASGAGQFSIVWQASTGTQAAPGAETERVAARDAGDGSATPPATKPLQATAALTETARTGIASPAPLPAAREGAPQPGDEMQRVEVRRGDSLYLIFQRSGLMQGDLLDLLASGTEGKKLKRLRPGQSVSFQLGPSGELSELHHTVDELTTVRFKRSEDGFESRVETRDYDRQVAVKNGVIRSSLFAAAGGVPEKVVHEFVSVLEWDIDFSRDLLPGDSFSLLYEELSVDGRRVRSGNVLALEFRSQRAGKPIRAFRYTDSNGETDYFTPDGQSLRRAFTRNPLRFTRISSKFSKSRLHPKLRVWRPHRGVDYAAPRGTRIRATGDGQISFVGRKGGYGKTIVITHGRGHTTLYAHLSRYAKGMKKGARVQQGQLIGYVGATGVATGPHLHYEFRVNGVHRDPLTVELPRSAPLDKDEMKRFRQTIAPLMARIETLGATKLARLER